MPSTFTCDACDEEISATTKKELRTDGWEWYEVGYAKWFVMCGRCVELYAQRRQAKAAAA